MRGPAATQATRYRSKKRIGAVLMSETFGIRVLKPYQRKAMVQFLQKIDAFVDLLTGCARSPIYYCAFHKHEDSEVQKPTDDCVSLSSIILTDLLENKTLL